MKSILLLQLLCTIDGTSAFAPSSIGIVPTTKSSSSWSRSLAAKKSSRSSSSSKSTPRPSKKSVGDKSYNDADPCNIHDNAGHVSSDLQSLLPTPKTRELKLDEFGRRIQRMEDDTTVNYSKSPPSSSSSSNTNSVAPPTLHSDKALAADASSADFNVPVSSSADLKALLPTQKMRFMKLDKFGRRIQRMEDDGTVNMMKEPAKTKSANIVDKLDKLPSHRGTPEGFTSDSANTDGDEMGQYSSLSDVLNDHTDRFGRPLLNSRDASSSQSSSASSSYNNNGGGRKAAVDESLEEERAMMDLDVNSESSSSGASNYGALKDLLPTKRDTWTKLDFKGGSVVDDRRVKQTSGDSSGRGSAAIVSNNNYLSKDGLKELLPQRKSFAEDRRDARSRGSGVGRVSGGSNLQDLLPNRATWTRLDVKGNSVIDERRIKKTTSAAGEDTGDIDIGSSINDSTTSSNCLSGGGLKDLLPKRAMWTRLDFKGNSVIDERRVKPSAASGVGSNAANSSSSNNEGTYSNLSSLLPKRTNKWKKEQGVATSARQSVREERRETRQDAMKNEVIASAKNAVSNNEEDGDGRDDGEEGDGSSSDAAVGSYTNLKDLLPERKMTWRTTK